MMSRVASTASIRPVWRRFRHNRRGSAAVEFALVAPVFFALLFAIIETGIIFFAGQILQTVATDSARTILTGQTQTAGLTQAQFQSNVVCPLIPALLTCANLYVDVETSSSFSGLALNNEVVNGVFQSTSMAYNPGGPGDVVVLRLYYQWPLFVTGLGYNTSNLANGQRLLTAAAAFRNEPY
jgi:Flp pilus assembly protein TadG